MSTAHSDATQKRKPNAVPTISVVATVRNEKATIRSFVDSLLRQSLPPDEIIIVDGASTDGTKDILSEFASAGRIHLISQDCNIAQGRNLGIRQARNEFVAITDAGCRVDQLWLQNIAECFVGPEHPDVVAGNFAFDCQSDFERAVVYSTFTPSRETSPSARYYPSSRSVAFRKQAWEAARGYPEWLYAAEDTLLNVRLRQLGFKFVFCRSALVYWRPRETWGKLARQRFNFSRGNARVGIAKSGYITNIQFHAVALLLLAIGILWWPVLIPGLLVIIEHVRRHLWSQAAHAGRATGRAGMRLRVLAVMEFIRFINMFGFLAGTLDRVLDPSYKARQLEWMGVTSLDQLRDFHEQGSSSTPRRALRAKRSLRLPASLLPLPLLAAAPPLVATTLDGSRLGIAAIVVALLVTVALLLKSCYDFGQTGPPLRREIIRRYRWYSLLALFRLAIWAFVLCGAMAWLGAALYGAIFIVAGFPLRFGEAIAAAAIGLLTLTSLQFCRHLLYLPGSITASSNYRISRLYPLWRRLTPDRLLVAQWFVGSLAVVLFAASAWTLVSSGQALAGLGFALAGLLAPLAALAHIAERDVRTPAGKPSVAPNIVMIGSDTLRADRVGQAPKGRMLTPFIDSLAVRGTRFTACYVPCARTAPSLLSLMTGTWPHRHGIRDNFVGDYEMGGSVTSFAKILADQGYRTAAVSDWSGGDFGKFPLGFENLDLPKDQWNIKYLIRQGPKDLRIFLSLFTHNAFGKWVLPELYYLAGVPLTSYVGRDARTLITHFAERGEPFLLNVFISTTHPPFGSEYPYYTLWADTRYAGESKFVMAGLTDPWEIVRRQADTRKDFDLDQIIDLYDGCVRNFDDEVKRIVRHLEACGLRDNTIVVIYSDHGMEFFEHGTWGQGNSVLGDASARVPLVVVDPRLPGDRVCPQVTRSIDVAPTLLELAGIEVPKDMDGVSLVPYLKGEVADLGLTAFNETGIWLADLPGMAEDHLRYPNLLELLEVPDRGLGTLAIKPQYRQIVIAAKDRMVREGSWKLIYQPTVNGPQYALFDLVSDPECQKSLIMEHPEIAQRLKARLLDWLADDVDMHRQQASHESSSVANCPRVDGVEALPVRPETATGTDPGGVRVEGKR